jgi:hypothetical protein
VKKEAKEVAGKEERGKRRSKKRTKAQESFLGKGRRERN